MPLDSNPGTCANMAPAIPASLPASVRANIEAQAPGPRDAIPFEGTAADIQSKTKIEAENRVKREVEAGREIRFSAPYLDAEVVSATDEATVIETMTVFASGRNKTGKTEKPESAKPPICTRSEEKEAVSSKLAENTATEKPEKTDELSNADFLEVVFAALPSGASPLVVSFKGDPHQVKPGAWAARPWPRALAGGANNYFALASYFPGDDGKISRRKTHFAALHALLLDDLGTKASMDRLDGFPLSWLVETSEGNYQGGILLAEPLTDAATATRLMDAIIAVGLCDPGANGPMARVARLPVAVNGKTDPPFPCRLVEWRPEARYTPEDIVIRLQLDLKPAGRPAKEKKSRRADHAASGGDDVHIPRPEHNPVIAALQQRGLYKSPLGGGRHDITCPWVSEHTDAVDNGAAYFEPDDGFPLGGFKCLHSHGDRLHIRDLLNALEVPAATARMKPTIRVVAGEIHRVVDRAELELATRGRHYQSGGLIVSVTTRPDTRDPVIQPTSAPALTRELAAAATWEKFDARSEDWARCDPPARHVGVLFDAQAYEHLHPLSGLARQPYYRDDGHLVCAAGYDRQSGLFGVFDPREFPIKRNPSASDAREALELLTGLLTEFRFQADHDKSAALAAILTATTRPSLPLAPAFHVRAPTISSGKSYLCKLFGAFAGPGGSSPCSYPTDGAEATKTLLALLLTAPAVIEFDDMTTDLLPFGPMNRVLTEPRISDRILGESKTVSVSTRALFLSSGNNVGPVRDMLRRVVTIRIDPRCQTPALIKYRRGPVEEVRAARGRFVAAALTIIEAWKQAGCPRTEVSPVATYTGAWSDYCRFPLLWLGLPDPATELFEQLSHDPDADALGRMLALWRAEFKSEPMAVRDVLRKILPTSELMDAFREVAEERGEINRNRLGWWLKRHEKRIVNGLEFRREDRNQGRVAWYVAGAASEPEAQTPDSQEDHDTEAF